MVSSRRQRRTWPSFIIHREFFSAVKGTRHESDTDLVVCFFFEEAFVGSEDATGALTQLEEIHQAHCLDVFGHTTLVAAYSHQRSTRRNREVNKRCAKWRGLVHLATSLSRLVSIVHGRCFSRRVPCGVVRDVYSHRVAKPGSIHGSSQLRICGRFRCPRERVPDTALHVHSSLRLR